jgi:hypothetical protein
VSDPIDFVVGALTRILGEVEVLPRAEALLALDIADLTTSWFDPEAVSALFEGPAE